MSTLAGLADVDWSAVSHAYGRATDVPDLLRALQDPAASAGALETLDSGILHQGTYYPATTTALPFLAGLACDPATPERPHLLAFLASVGASVPDSRIDDVRGLRGHYLPPGIDLDAFEQGARDAFAAACLAIRPCLDDPDTEVRAAVADVWRTLTPLPDALVAALRDRLSIEDESAAGAIAGTLINAGHFTDADRAAIGHAPPAARFAAAVIALQSAQPLDAGDLATVRALWATCAPAFTKSYGYRDLFDSLLARHKGAILPLVDDLAASLDPAWKTEAIVVYRDLARLSRGATDAVITRLTRLASGGTSETRNRLASIFRELIALDQRGGTRIADALYGIVVDDPAAGWALAAKTLQRIGDSRSMHVIELGIAAGASVGQIVPLLLAEARAADDADILAAALNLLRDQIRREPADGAALLWTLFHVPETAARRLAPEVMACLPFSPLPACNLLARWNVTEAAGPMRRALVDVEPRDRGSAHAALAELTGDASEFDRGWATSPDGFDDDAFSRWAAMPTSTLATACRAKLASEPSPSDMAVRLAAAEALLPIDGLAAVWPSLCVVAEAGGYPAHDAIVVVVDALKRRPEPVMRDTVVALFEDMRANGRRTFLGNDLDAPVEAASGLRALGAGSPVALADTCMTTLRIAHKAWLRHSTPDLACDILVALARDDDSIRSSARACLAEVLADDVRVGWRGSDSCIASDEAFQATLRRAAAAIG